MDLIVSVALPISLAIIMLSLGVELEIADFRRVFQRRFPFAIGVISQMLLLPTAAFVVVMLFQLPPEIALGFMILSFSPGGVTSNILTKFAKGDVALSVSLTAIISLVSVITIPVFVAWFVKYFLAEKAPDVSVAGLALAMFMITTLPTICGVALRHFARNLAQKIQKPLSALAAALFMLVVIAAISVNWELFKANFKVLGPSLIVFNIVLLCIGLGIAKLARLSWAESKTISIETGLQNAALGITTASLVAGTSADLTTVTFPSATYGVTMYLVAIPFLLWFRAR